MEFLGALWMPIVLSAVLVFVASALTHTVLPLHKSEFKKLPNEDELMALVSSVPPELYFFPCPSTAAEMKDPAFVEKNAKGPNGMLIRWPGQVNMGQNLAMTFLFYVVVGVFVAYLGWHTIASDASYLQRFRICGAVALCAYGLGWIQFFIWYRYGRVLPNMVDSILYALITAGTFAWLWPHS